MSITKARLIYKGGYNKEYFIDEMSTSHILNVLTLLDNKADALSRIAGRYKEKSAERTALLASKHCVMNDIEGLTEELSIREDCLECC